MQQIEANQPVCITPEHAAACPHRRNPRYVAAVRESGADHVELALDARCAAVDFRDIELALEFAAAEDGVALRVNRLLQSIGRVAVAAGSKIVGAHRAGEPAEDEIAEAGII